MAQCVLSPVLTQDLTIHIIEGQNQPKDVIKSHRYPPGKAKAHPMSACEQTDYWRE